MNEVEFLINLAVSEYNDQYGAAFKPKDFDIKSLRPSVNFDKGYEIYTVRTDDFLRLRMYFAFGNRTDFGPFKLEVDGKKFVAELGDEVFVTLGSVEDYYKNEGIYKFRWIGENPGGLFILADQDKAPIVLANGLQLIIQP